MLSKTEIFLLLCVLLAFVAGGIVEAFFARMRADGRGLFGGLLAEGRWVSRQAGRAWGRAKRAAAPAASWVVKNLDRYQPVLATRTGAGGMIAGVASKIGIIFPWLNIAPAQIELAVCGVCLFFTLYGVARVLYGRRHAEGRVQPRTRDEPDNWPRPVQP
jgi:hypothetical protein